MVELEKPNEVCEVPEMNKLLQLTVIQYQVCYELLHGDNRKSQLVISQVTQVTKQGLDVVQAQQLLKTKTSVVRYTVTTDCTNRGRCYTQK